MNTLLISITLLMGIASCNSTPQESNQADNAFFYEKMGNDTLVSFESETAEKLPLGFVANATNKAKSIKWNVVDDNGNKVVVQQAINSGSCYNLLVLDKFSYKDFTVSVKIKAISGEEDQGGGLVWRYIDKDNYYIARYNPLENNLRFYSVVNGSRKQLESVGSAIKQGEWFTMTVEMEENKVTCSLNGEKLIDLTDDAFKSGGLIGFWTKADAVTYFDDLKITTEK